MENSEMKQKPLHVLTVSYLTQLFLLVRDWNNALVYARKGLQLESTAFDKNSKLFLLQSIGLIYHRLNILDSSDYYFQKMLIHAKEEKDSLSMYNAYGYIAENHIKKKEYLKALPLIEMQKKYAIQIGDPSLTAFDLLLEADIYFQLGNLGKSKALTYESEKYVYAANMDNTYKSFYTLMVKNLISAGDRKQGKLYLDSLFYMSEKIDTKINVVKGLKVEQLYTLDLVEKKAAIEQIANKKIHERNIYLIIIFLLSSLFVFLLYRNRQNKMRLLMLLEKQSLENELISVQDELAEFITKIDLQAKEIMHWNEEKITTPEEWNHFMELFSKTNPGFIQKVKDTLLGITPAELRFLCLSKVRITDIQMAVILGVNPNSVRQTRKRVKEKFGFETNESLMVLIEKI
jgi:DNA-binding CsgD family transcriptional regulator